MSRIIPPYVTGRDEEGMFLDIEPVQQPDELMITNYFLVDEKLTIADGWIASDVDIQNLVYYLNKWLARNDGENK